MHRRALNHLGRALASLSITLVLSPFLHAQTNSTQWSVAVLDKLLAGVAPGQRLVQVGDMQVLTNNLQAWRRLLAGAVAPDLAFDGTAPTWTGDNVYYTFDSSVSAAHQKAFLDGANEWATFASLRVIARTTQANYVTIQEVPSLQGGQSAVGMVGGQQFLSIGPTSWNRPTICHEFGHTLGLVHEHQRSDRDSFVAVLTTNIQSGQVGNFVLLPDSRNQGAYDFLSIMHYNRNSFAINPPDDTLEPLPPYVQYLNLMGQQYDPVLSALDRAGMAAIYGSGPAIGPVVTNTLDSGPGSLRTAIYYALDHPETTITFNLQTNDPGFANHVFTIQPTDQYPSLINATVLDGASQTNLNPNGPAVQLSGALAPSPSVFPNGLRLAGSNCMVRSLTINGFAASGILINGPRALSNAITGCYLGLDPTGTLALTNGLPPLSISDGARANTIGGLTPTARNVISGSAYQGLVIRDPGTVYNIVEGNYIGLNATGTAAVSNRLSGVAVFNGAQSNLIGGTLPSMRNIISGNGNQGLTISGPGTDCNRVEGNYLGLNPLGTGAIPNGWAGLDIFGGAKSNVIGGAIAGGGNVISGNTLQGMIIADTNTSGNVVMGNYIGSDSTGTLAISNGWSGVQIFGGAEANVVGGAGAGARNLISGNGNAGVMIDGPGTGKNVVQGNYIGLSPSGTAAIGNGWSGVSLRGGTTGNLIGGPGAGNILSGNGNQGVVIADPGTMGNVLAGNLIGLNAAGTAAVSNTWSGVAIFNQAQSNMIGGVVPGMGNVISGNGNQGVVLADLNTQGNTVAGNYIGLDAMGTLAVANAWAGIDIFNAAHANLIGGGVGARNIISGNGLAGVSLSGGVVGTVLQGNTIGLSAGGTPVPNHAAGVVLFGGAISNQVGGVAFGAANVIANNLSDGVQLFDPTTAGNAVRGNSIFGNSGVGIALYSGANLAAAGPTLSNAVLTTSLTITGGLSSLPNTTFHLDFYASPPPQISAQASSYIGAKEVATSGGGDVSFAASLGAVVPIGHILTATATDPEGNTSPLCAGIAVTGIDSVGDGISDAWRAARFGGVGTTTNSQSCATCDPDHDGMNNLQEFLSGTSPTNAASALRIAAMTHTNTDVTLHIQSVAGIVYRIEVRDALASDGWSFLINEFLGTGGTMQVTDPGVLSLPAQFYRLSVNP
jgi:hypothetical protein